MNIRVCGTVLGVYLVLLGYLIKEFQWIPSTMWPLCQLASLHQGVFLYLCSKFLLRVIAG